MKQPAAPCEFETRNNLFASWTNFWFVPADPVGLSVLRVLGGLVFLYWLLPFAGDVQAFFGLGGWFDARAYAEASRLQELPPHLFTWSAAYWCGNNATLLTVLYGLSIAAIVLFTLGVATRLTGVLTWAAVVSFTANPAIAYDADPLLQMLAFYLMLGHLFLGLGRPETISTPARSVSEGRPRLRFGLVLKQVLGPTRETWLFGGLWPKRGGTLAPSIASNLALRLLQVHFALAMVATGLHKLQVSAWWSGLAPWFYLHPPFHTTMRDIREYAPPNAESYLNLFSLTAYAVLAWQIGFPAFAWRRWLRPLLLGGAIFGWLMTALAMQMPLVGPLLFVLCLAYVTPTEWRWVENLLARLPLFDRLCGQEPASPVRQGVKGGSRAGAITVGSRS